VKYPYHVTNGKGRKWEADEGPTDEYWVGGKTITDMILHANPEICTVIHPRGRQDNTPLNPENYVVLVGRGHHLVAQVLSHRQYPKQVPAVIVETRFGAKALTGACTRCSGSWVEDKGDWVPAAS